MPAQIWQAPKTIFVSPQMEMPIKCPQQWQLTKVLANHPAKNKKTKGQLSNECAKLLNIYESMSGCEKHTEKDIEKERGREGGMQLEKIGCNARVLQLPKATNHFDRVQSVQTPAKELNTNNNNKKCTNKAHTHTHQHPRTHTPISACVNCTIETTASSTKKKETCANAQQHVKQL